MEMGWLMDPMDPFYHKLGSIRADTCTRRAGSFVPQKSLPKPQRRFAGFIESRSRTGSLSVVCIDSFNRRASRLSERTKV